MVSGDCEYVLCDPEGISFSVLVYVLLLMNAQLTPKERVKLLVDSVNSKIPILSKHYHIVFYVNQCQHQCCYS